ncbi:hypothetical protein SS05631_a43770 (plasmid) [Sinorhizobium sp. CCBAU 05631]|nr:hypothetical protein SS05631_a43770 [Sinorhizobium sp. CCBAU 05631]
MLADHGAAMPLDRPVTPEEVASICQALDQLLDEYRIPREGEEAEALAAKLFTIYQTGVRDIELLKTLAIAES